MAQSIHIVLLIVTLVVLMVGVLFITAFAVLDNSAFLGGLAAVEFTVFLIVGTVAHYTRKARHG